MEGNPVVVSSIIEDAFLISCLVLALQNAEQAIKRNSEVDNFLDDCQTSIEAMLLKRLLTTAGMIRNLVFEKYPPEMRSDEWRQFAEREVGLLSRDGRDPTPLHFYDSCNKILHHRSYSFPASDQLSDMKARSSLSLQDCAQFSGARQKSEWHAIINLHKFASAAWVCADIDIRV
ncbi:hypothetical protein X739_28740 [Mesorhizobium sp. LNHC220B00]|uniref:hypothetical protein n=1 Tax=Mesorhizobium sp. LNHC229A00 TaxID=1287240 RepID=UPI0003CF6405|nr:MULTISPECIES: hypothetical protein [unclassified Mesorhizobium]ESY76355.1 hypothetical protein X741_34640 [Mesorhizobium sp. LNHC229A00]ESY80723.1 hypothetical protein X739_28740 [Mesorhizobium sp. LNHC220B00]